jgi:hypothetical protein
MNHQPFEDWLLDDEPLTVQQRRELERHLRDCTSCSDIAESNLALHASRRIAPKAGFPERFEMRLQDWRQREARNQVVGTLILVVGGLTLLVAFTGPAILDALSSPATWITAATTYLVFVLTSAHLAGEIGGILFRALSGLISPASWFVAVLVSGGALTAWRLSMQRLARSPQGVRK